jgi:cobaltochelatase CobN
MLAELTPKIGFAPIFASPDEIVGDPAPRREDVAKCQIDFVLNMDTSESAALVQFFTANAASVPNRKILALDARPGQADLQNAKLLQPDAEIPKYWVANGDTNVQRLLNYVMIHYYGAKGEIQPPIDIPDAGYYDPARENDAFPSLASYKEFKKSQGRWKEGAPVVALLTQQSFWITHDTKVLAAQVYALERHGMNPVVIFGDRESDIASMLDETHPDGIIEDRHGAMWNSRDRLEKFDVPYFRPISMLLDTVDKWKADPQGLSFTDVNLFMTLQESWGTIEPIVVGGLHALIPGLRMHDPIPDGIERFAARVASTLNLRTKPEAEKRVAIVYLSAGVGVSDLMRGSPTGMYLDGPASLMKFLPEMKRRGYTVDSIPKDPADLIHQLQEKAHNVGLWTSEKLEDLVKNGDPVLVPAEDYERWFHEKLSPENQQKMIAAYGPPPGKFMVIERDGKKYIVLPRLQFGNVLLMPQPLRGQVEDYTLVHSRDVPPPHNYLAFYWWLQEGYKADAVIHWGTHGTLEMLPGKEAGMSRDDWGDICIGNLPNIDLWIMDNLAEATLARRRSYAVIVDHMVPPTVNAGIAEQYRSISDDIDKFDALDSGMIKTRYRARISETARKERIDETLKFPRSTKPFTDDQMKAVAAYIEQLDEAKEPLTLHVLGEAPEAKYLAPYLVSIEGANFLKHLNAADLLSAPPVHDPSDSAKRLRLRGEGEKLIQTVVIDNGQPAHALTPDLKEDLDFARKMLTRLNSAGDEVDGLFRALDARYVHPGPGPEPIRNPASVPAGRNLYSLNPEEIPTRPAWDTAVALVDDFLKNHPVKKVGMDLNGMDTMVDFGVMEGQILYLMGVQPVWDRNNLAIDVKLIPRAELGRPRVDVFIAMGGMYKENFPSRVELLDKAVRMVSAADEPDNYVRQGTLANLRKFEQAGASPEDAKNLAVARIFGTKPGDMSGTNILYLVPNTGYWQKNTELTDVYIDHMSYVYTKGLYGKKVPGLYEQNIQGTEALIRDWSSNMSSQLSNHHAYEYLGGLSMAVKQLTGKEPTAYIADVRDPDGARMRDFDEVLQTDFRTQLLNPNWVKGMEQHGYAGAGQVSELVTNTFGWAVTRDNSISDATWSEINNVYFKDKFKLGTREWMEKANPHAMQDIAARLLEANHRGLWHTDAATLNQLAMTVRNLEVKYGSSGDQLSANNASLKQFIAEHAAVAGVAPGTAPGPGKPAATSPAKGMSARARAAAAAAVASLQTVTGQVLAVQHEIAAAPVPGQSPLPQPVNRLALFAYLFLAVIFIAAGYASRRGAI